MSMHESLQKVGKILSSKVRRLTAHSYFNYSGIVWASAGDKV